MRVLDVEHEAADLHHGEDGSHSKTSEDDNSVQESAVLPLSISAPPKKIPSSKPSISKVDLPFKVTAPPKKPKKPTVNKREMTPMLITTPPKKKSIAQLSSSAQPAAASKPTVTEQTRNTVPMPETNAFPSDRENQPLLAENIANASDAVSAVSMDSNGSASAKSSPDTLGAGKVAARAPKSKALAKRGAGAKVSTKKKKLSQTNKIAGKNKTKGKRGKGKGRGRGRGKGRKAIAQSNSDSNQRGNVRRKSSTNTAAQNAKMVKAMAMEKFQGRRTGGHGITLSEYKSLLQGPLAAAMGLKPKKKKKKKPKKRKISKLDQRKQAAKLSAGGVSDAGLKAKERTRRKTSLASERTAENLAKIKKRQVLCDDLAWGKGNVMSVRCGKYL